MTEQELNRRLAQAAAHAAPDDVESVLSRCETRKGTVIPMEKKKIGAMARGLAAACLALALVGGGGGLYYQQVHAVASVVSLDVNPSVELKVNRGGKVISCAALNEDAAQVLSDMGGGADLKGTKLDVAVNAIVGALVRSGYLDSISSAILISVEDKDQERAARLQQELTQAVDGILQAQDSGAAVLSQTLTQDAGLEEQARTNNISTGKAALVNQVLARNSQLEFEKLALLSVEELKDMAKMDSPAMPIGKARAQTAAEEYAGTLAVDSVTAEVDSELDERIPHYEVELHHPVLGKFEYVVDAYTGQVLSGQADILDGSSAPQVEIGQASAKKAALDHAGLTEEDTAALFVDWDREDGRLRYEVEFYAGGYEYGYEIDGYTGAVLDWSRKADEKGVIGGSQGHTVIYTVSYISQEEAKQAALDHAGVDQSQVSEWKIELHEEDGHGIYEVEFRSGDIKYEYEIDAVDGAVWKCETHQKKASEGAAATSGIGESAAKSAAFQHAGVTESQVTKLKVERKDHDGRLEYEVEFQAGDVEYEYTIDGATGAVLEHEMDQHH